ncbi:MAG: alpha/beta hydrolase [Chloroflexi bacterium]|nr:alpha/beta hydrolase [Chloroflexota bacterium]
MAVEARTAHTPPSPGQSVLRYALWATAATLGVSGAATAAVSMAAGFLVYQYARHRGQWGTDEPPDGLSEEVSFPSAADGIRLSGWYFRAADATPDAPRPVIILCHGIWTGRRECLPLALRFQAAGYNVLTFDFRAHGLSDGRFTSVGHHETNDVLGAIEYVKDRPEVDTARIGLVGFSMGAAAAIQATARSNDVAAVVADSAYASFLDAVRYSFHVVTRVPQFPLAPMAMRWAKWMVNVDAGKLRPIDVIGHISPRPLLIAHGELDEIVPVQHAHSLFQAAGEPKELWVDPHAHHVGARDMDTDGYFVRIQRFFAEAFSAVGPSSGVPLPTS